MVPGAPRRHSTWRSGLARIALVALLLGLATGGAAASDVYTYKIEHPTLGNIGSYVDTVTRNADGYRIDNRMHVLVRVLGIVLHREDAERTEIWRGGRLVSFHGVTTTNGERIEVRGEAEGDQFVITTPRGSETVAANIRPSDPWSAAAGSGPSLMMSTKTGKLFQVRDATVENTTLRIGSVDVPVQHYVFMTDKRQEVWKNAHGVPVEFRSAEAVGPIDFILVKEALASDSATLPPADTGNALAAKPH